MAEYTPEQLNAINNQVAEQQQAAAPYIAMVSSPQYKALKESLAGSGLTGKPMEEALNTLKLTPDEETMARTMFWTDRNGVQYFYPDESYVERYEEQERALGINRSPKPFTPKKETAEKQPESKEAEETESVNVKSAKTKSVEDNKADLKELDRIITGQEKMIDEKYSHLIKDGVFVGSESQYQNYKDDIKSLDTNIDDYNATAEIVNKRTIMTDNVDYLNAIRRVNEDYDKDKIDNADYFRAIRNKTKDDDSVEIDKKLEPYKITEEGPFIEDNGVITAGSESFDIARFLRDHPGDTQTLLEKGFSKDSIEEAKDYNKATRGIDAPDYVSSKEYIKQYFKEKGWGWGSESQVSGKEYEDRQAEAKKAHDKLFQPKVSQEQFIDTYFADRGMEYNPRDRDRHSGESSKEWQRRVEKQDKTLIEATDLYAKKYGTGAVVETGLARIGEFAFTPARVARPEIELKNLDEKDVIRGAIDIAIWFAPGAILKGISKIAKPSTKVMTVFSKDAQAVEAVLKETNPELVKPLQKLSQAQAEYAEASVKLADAEKLRAGHLAEPGPDVNVGWAYQPDPVPEAMARVKATRESLKRAAQEYADVLKHSNKLKLDDPRIKESFDRISDDITRHTDDVVEDILKARMKPSPTLEKLQTELAKAKQEIPKLEAKLKESSNTVQSRKTLAELNKQRKIVETYPDKIRKELKNLDIESMVKTDESGNKRFRKERESRFGGGNTAVKDRPGTPTRRNSNLDIELSKTENKSFQRNIVGTGGGVGTKSDTSQKEAVYLDDAISTQTLTDTGTKTSTKTMPGVFTSPSSKPKEFISPDQATQLKNELSTKTGTATKLSSKTKPKAETKSSTEVKPKPATGTKTKTKTDTKTQVKPKPKLPEVPPKLHDGLDDKDDEQKNGIAVKSGTGAWQQGSLEVDASHPGPEPVYKISQPPDYEVQTSINKPPIGYQDKGSTPRDTFQIIGGPVKKDIKVDMGIVEARVPKGTKDIQFLSTINTEDKKHVLINANRGRTIGWQIKPNDKNSRWMVLINPYTPDERIVVVNKLPASVKAVRSARGGYRVANQSFGNNREDKFSTYPLGQKPVKLKTDEQPNITEPNNKISKNNNFPLSKQD